MSKRKNENLIQQIKAGDEKAVKEIYIRYKIPCIGWIIKYSGYDKEEATTIFLESVVVLYENIVSGKLVNFSSTIKTYLIGIAKNKVSERKRLSNKIDYQSDWFLFADLVDTNDIEKLQEKEILYQKIERSLKELGKKCRQLLEAFYFRQFSIKEIVKQFEYNNDNSAKTAKYKCLKQLRGKM